MCFFLLQVLEQHSDGRWKGCIHDNRTGNDRVGYFPSSIVEVICKRPGPTGARGSESSPHGSPTPSGGPQGCSNEEIWVLRKPVAGGDRSSVGSSGSVASARSSGSGQSAGSSSHILHAQAEGVKLLATVLSQSAKAKEHLLEQSKSLEHSSITTAKGPTSRSQSVSSCPLHEQPYSEAPQRKAEVLSEGKDLTAIGVTKPGHRKKMTSEINKLSVTEWTPDQKPANLGEWLTMIGLSQYHQVLVQNGYENIEFITDITWEDLQEIGITKLGHQKKLMLAVKKLAELQKSSENRNMTRKKPQLSQDMVAIESPPPDSGECMSPKMTTFQDSELSGELQAALTRPGNTPDGPDVRNNANGGPVPQQRSRSLHENSINKSRDSEEPIGPPRKEARTMRQSSQAGSQRGSTSQPKPRQSYPQGSGPPYTPPQTPTKTKPPSSQTMGSSQAKPKPSPQLLQQTERPMSPRPAPQSPTHRAQPQPSPQPTESVEAVQPAPPVSVPLLCLPPEGDSDEGNEQGTPKKRAHSLNRYAVSDGEQEREELNVQDTGGKYATVQHRVGRSNSMKGQADKNVNRSQSFALRQKKKGPPPPPPKRSSSAISSSSSNLTEVPKETGTTGHLLDVNYQPQRRASDLGGTVDTGSAGSVRSIAAMLEMSSIGGGAKGLAQKSTGHFLQVGTAGGKQHDAIGLDGEVVNRRRTISGPVTDLVAAAKREQQSQPVQVQQVQDKPPKEPQPNSTGTSAENLPFAEDGNLTIKQRPRQGKGEGEEVVDSMYPLPQEEIPNVDGTGTLKRRAWSSKQHQEEAKFHLTESNTVKRRPKSRETKESEEPQQEEPLVPPYQNGTGTIKRRPTSEVTVSEQPRPQEHVENKPRRDSTDSTDSAARKPVKPPVSPKPVLAQHLKKQIPPATVTKKASFPGPGAPGSPGTTQCGPFSCPVFTQLFEGKKIPPPISPKPTPPPTAPKPPKNVLQSMNPPPGQTPIPSPGKPPVVKIDSPVLATNPAKSPTPPTPPAQSPQTPHTPQTPVTPQTPQTPVPPPVKPPRSSISGVSMDSGSGGVGPGSGVISADAVHQKIEETSASLAAALLAVEEKIKEDRHRDSVSENKSTVSILDDIGSMFDDLADQLDAMLE
uniref:CASK interacting protein 1 n=1 Tax=Astyanax mexicanus TaxID=7994 RepID=A0A3B1IQ55_ASTMX